MNSMTYRGYTARVEFDDRDDIFIGRVLGARDAISFHADSVADLRKEFQTSVDDYLDYCAERGMTPDERRV
jgi:predicted HicB family RNase H-like nuclease